MISRALLSAALAASPTLAAEPLRELPIDPARVSVSGVSSGAFMANQLHLAHSGSYVGAGLVAGGLYGCAVEEVARHGLVGSAAAATGRCMSAPELLPAATRFAETVRSVAAEGWIDPLAGLADDRVYLFAGSADAVVAAETVERAAELYRALGLRPEAIAFHDRTLSAGHAWVTLEVGEACDANRDPYINACGFDLSGEILAWLHGPLAPRGAARDDGLVAFDQTAFAPGGLTAPIGLLQTGAVYIPAACAPGAPGTCALHVALHGCRQSAELIGDAFQRGVGLNEWAETNAIVVLYPQAAAVSVEDFPTPGPGDLAETNPEGCWNWWGYGYDDRFALADGAQLAAIHAMVARLTGRSEAAR